MAVVVARERKRPRNVWQVLLGLALAAFFTVGIIALMLVLAGAFKAKVKVGTPPSAHTEPPQASGLAIGVVTHVRTVRESLALRLKVGQRVPARLDTSDGECRAAISEIVPETQAESRSFQVKVTGPCPPNVYSGMFGRIFIPLEDENVLAVPAGAVRRVGPLDEVDIVEDGAVSRRAVQLGRTLDEGREVLSGLADGEHVVLLKETLKTPAGGRP